MGFFFYSQYNYFLISRHGFLKKPVRIDIAGSRSVPTCGAVSGHIQAVFFFPPPKTQT
jgi:hypothetical protein